MHRTRWLITIALGLAPMLGSMALQRASGSAYFSASAAAGSNANSGGNNSSSNSSGNNGSNSSSSSSSSSSAVSVGVAPRAKVTNPHGPLATPCANCHTYTSWKPIRSNPDFNHDLTGYPLRGMHQNVACSQCHTSMMFKNVGSQCADCHADIHHRQFGANCSQCHSVKGWQVSLQAIQNHSNRFPLVGAHSVVQCEECHKQAAVGQFRGLSTSCYSCHQKDFLTPVVDHVGLGFPTTCDSCHSLNSWFNAKFDHLKYTGYALTGAHATLDCIACHANNVYKGTPAQCYGCHSADYKSSNNPNHVQLGLPETCQTCHTTVDWTTTTFDHATYAHWPLTGKHATVPCIQCHTNNNYNLTAAQSTCISCHTSDYNGTTDPPHATLAQFFPAATCSTCHTTSAWTGATFNHDATGFTLTGAHQTTACSACHVSNNYSLGAKDATCDNCHHKDYVGATNPNHTTNGFPVTCQQCHNTVSWTQATFNHNNTGFPLTGAHTTAQCSACHINNNYNLGSTQAQCDFCHDSLYMTTTSPNHTSANYPKTCETCHNTTSWTTATFDHNTTGFPLTGAHTSLQCTQCHINNNYSLGAKDATCDNCHHKDYVGATNPAHTPTAFPTSACSTCHNTTSWTTATFNHNNTGFPLTGAHTTAQCSACHINNNYNLGSTQAQCDYCHDSLYMTTTSPNHTSANYPKTCETCHNTTSWTTATFDHSTTGFPLTGFHATMQCVQCHTNNNYKLGAMTCDNCHHQDYLGTTNPNHVTSNFPTTCDACHTTTSWAGANFNHNNTGFPLTGFHTTVPCASCHINNNYSLGAMTCDNCHDADYMGTTSPNHSSLGWPKTCDTCHTTTAWLPANLPTSYHTFFPVNHGNANGVCATCHTGGTNYAVFQCTGCHGGNNSANFHHPGVNGYVYNSVNCYACHKGGGGG